MDEQNIVQNKSSSSLHHSEEMSRLKQTIIVLQAENEILTDALTIFLKHAIQQTKN